MRIRTIIGLHIIPGFVFFLLITSCNSKKTIPFPEDAPGNMPPVSKPLQFSEEHVINWEVIDPDSVRPPKTTKFDFASLPSKPFKINDFKPLKNPVQVKKLDWDNIPDSTINLDTIPAKPFRPKKYVLPQPEIIKAGIPKIMFETTTGLIRFGPEEGLPSFNVFASLADKNGTVWIATDKGLCAYDGENFYKYTFFTGQAGGNAASIVFGMGEDPEGNIWLTTGGGGIYIMDVKNGILSHYATPVFTLAFCFDHEGNVWVSSFRDKLLLINKERTSVKEIQWPDAKKFENWTIGIKEDRYHNIWLGNFNHLSIIDPARKKIKKLGAREGVSFQSCLTLYEANNGEMWVGAERGAVNAISLENKTITTLDEKNGFSNSGVEYKEDKRGQLWIVHNDSINVLNKQRDKSRTIITNATSFLNGMSGFTKDSLGNFWIGSKERGVMVIDPEGPLPEHLSVQNGLSDNNVWGMADDKNGRIWIGTYEGINIYDPGKNKISLLGGAQGLVSNNLRGLRKIDTENMVAGSPSGLSIINIERNTITSYGAEQGFAGVTWNGIKDPGGNIWLPSNPGMRLLNTETNTLKYADQSRGLLSDLVWDLTKDKQGNFWGATDSGAMIINPVTNTVKYLREQEGLCSNDIMKIAVNSEGEIWICTRHGISVVNTNTNTITALTKEEGLLPDEIYDMAEYGGKMYAGSVNGLIVITKPIANNDSTNKKSKWIFENYGKSRGFPYNDYNQMTAMTTADGQSWWGVSPVLTVLTQPAITDTSSSPVAITAIRILDQALSPTDFNVIKSSLQKEDSIWDETTRKFYSKNNLPANRGYMADKHIQYDSLAPLTKLPLGLKLSYNQNSLSFSFSNSSVIGRDKLVYRYVLEGEDEKWSDITENAFTPNYYNLSPGSYTFKVRSKGANGIWSEPAAYSFIIRSPWWLTWWAFLLYAVALSGVIWLIVQYRSRMLQKENKILEEKVSHRTAQLKKTIEELKGTQSQLIQSEKMASLGELTAGIAHEIQNPLNFVNNFSEVNSELIAEMKEEIEKGNFDEVKLIANDISENEQKIIFHGKRADAIVKGMLQHSRSSSGLKEPTEINKLADEYLRLAYHGLRAKDKSFNATMKTDFDETIGNVNVVPQDLGRVILNLITNAFYAVTEKKKQVGEGYDPTVTVSTKKMKNKIEIKVRDNGNGIPQSVLDKIYQPFFTTKPAGQGTGLGLSMSYDIVTKAHEGELGVKTKEGEFTEFTITLPQ